MKYNFVFNQINFKNAKNCRRVLISICITVLFTGLFSGCSREACHGKVLGCNSSDGKTFYGYFCTADAPPCQCYEYDGSMLFDQSGEFSKPCDPTITGAPSSGGTTFIDQPYTFDCPFSGSTLCTEFDTYYVDSHDGNYGTYASYDGQYRPIYVRFDVSDLSLKSFDYLFEVKEGIYNTVIHSFLLTGTSVSTAVVRYLNPVSCSSPSCSTQGVVKLDMKKSRNEGNYQVILYKQDRNGGAPVQIATTSFAVRKQESSPAGYSNGRQLKYIGYKHGTYDLFSYLIGNRTYAEALNYAFGDGKSNLIFSSQQKSIAKPFVDTQGDIMLRSEHFSFFRDLNDNINIALDEWAKEAYSNIDYEYPSFQGFAIEVEYMKKYNFDALPETADPAFPGEAVKVATYLGKTFRNWEGDDYYNGVVVLKHMVKQQVKIFSSDFTYFADDLSVETFLHELGHMWSISATRKSSSSDDCDRHIYTGNGKDFHACLWHVTCINSGRNPFRVQAWETQAISDPRFCEGHQQYFMNRLLPR